MDFDDKMKLGQDAFLNPAWHRRKMEVTVTKEEIVKTEALEARYKRYKSILKDLTIMSDVFMRNVFKKRECTEYVLQVIMEKKSADY